MRTWAIEFILSRPLWILALICLVTAPCIWLLSTSQFSTSILESFLDNREEYREAIALESQFSGNPDSLLWLATDEGQHLFTSESLIAIRQAARQIQRLPEVSHVTSLPDLDRPVDLQSGLRRTAQKILLNARLKQGDVPGQRPGRRPILPLDNKLSASALRELKQRLLSSRSFVRQLVSQDGHAHAMLIELKDPYQIEPYRQPILIDNILNIIRDVGLGRNGTYCAGLLSLQAYAYDQIRIVLYYFLPVGGFLIAAAVMFVFRRLEVVLITLSIAAISICWGLTVGLLGYGSFSILVAAMPLMVLVISTADVIHLISSYTAERAHGLEHRPALRKTFIEVGGACVLTSVTTFVGFASLVFVPSQTIRQFGVSSAAGVASALLLSVVLVPVFLDWLARRERPVSTTRSASRMTEWAARTCLHIACCYPHAVLVLFTLALVLCGWLSSRVTLDPDITKRFPPTHPVSVSRDYFADQFGGINSVEIICRAEEQLFSPETFQRMLDFGELCQADHGVTQVASVALVVQEFLRRLDYRNEVEQPESQQHLQACVAYLRQTSPELMNDLVTENGTQLRILLRIQETSYLSMLRVSEAIVEDARRLLGTQDVQIASKGSAPLIGRAVDAIIAGHMQGFFFCFSAIFLLITFGLKSFKLGLLSIFPNLTPLLLLAGIVGMRTGVVDSDILAVATLGLGLAVDDTIHYLSRFSIELRSSGSVLQALHRATSHTGLAIIRTTLILSLGFFPFAFSGYWSIQMLGTYLLVVLVGAVLADLVFLPAILLLAFPHGRSEVAPAAAIAEPHEA